MPKPRRKKRLDAGKEARRVARDRIGQPPAGHTIPDKRRKPPKHKKELVAEEFDQG